MTNVATISKTQDLKQDEPLGEMELLRVAVRRLEASRHEDTQILIQARDREIAMRHEINELKSQLADEKAKSWWQKLIQG